MPLPQVDQRNSAYGRVVRLSANTRSWEGAERKARLLEINADPLRQTPPDDNVRITVEEAV